MQGMKIGRFTLQTRIDSGATSVVYRALEAETGRTVAVKLLARALAFNAYARAQLLREIERLAALQHPQIVPILQTGMYREQVYLVLPYYAAGSLAQRIDRPWSLPETRQFVTQLAKPLETAHAEKIVHGRLKPTNILFDETDQPCVADFGLTQLTLANSCGWRGNALNVTAYTAPEQLMGMSLDGRTDIYAIGKLVQQLTGRSDVAREALAENRAQRPHTVADFATTLSNPTKPSWLAHLATRVADYLR